MFISFFGLIFILLCGVMVASPHLFSTQLIAFSNFKYFHPFEIVTRGFIAIMFWIEAASTEVPMVIRAMAIIFACVAVGLILVGAKRHRQFSILCANKIGDWFRLIGLVSWPAGVWLIHISY